MMRYSPSKIEAKWQKKWLAARIYEPGLRRAKKPAGGKARHGRPFYNLMMFPYPSAEGLHVGNMYAFTGADIYGRFKRMQGCDVFEPIGLDGFGIHSENYALQIGRHPADQAKISEENFYRQLAMIGNGFAWNERLETYDPDYYNWTQWIFIQMFKRGLAYRKKASVNWCPSCKTVLADEQVVGGECERCGAKVAKKDLEQWFFKITNYAERLLRNLERIDWSEKIKVAQRNWIGKSEGALIKFPVAVSVIASEAKQSRIKQEIATRPSGARNDEYAIEVFTTRPDTLFGATYMVLGPEHKIISKIKNQISNIREVEEYIRKAKAKTEEERIAEGHEKTGVELKGVKVVNPANHEEIPIWVSDYVLGNVGTGAIMAVPAHDQRDFEFAKKFKLPVKRVVEALFVQTTSPGKIVEGKPFVKREAVMCIVKHWREDKYIGLKWKKVSWQTLITGGIETNQTPVEAGVSEIIEETGYLHPKFVRELGINNSKFFHVPKQENRLGHFHMLYFELKDGSRKKVSEKENDIHDLLWLTVEEMGKFLSPSSHKYAWSVLQNSERAYTDKGILVDSGGFNGMDSEKAKWEITKFVGGTKKTQYRLRDWLISRQRYWGPPIPIIYCRKCWEIQNPKFKTQNKSKIQNSKLREGVDYAMLDGREHIIYAVPEKDLPVKLPYIKSFRPTGTAQSPLAAVEKFYKVKCPACGYVARRETDVSDTFLDSAWYYLRYPSAGYVSGPWDPKITKRWFPVNMYTGGAEHAVLHLLYVRFLCMVFYDWRLIHFEEPFKKFRAHGLLIKDGAKMSKSRGNVVNPDEYIRAYGADALRMYLMFLGPFENGGDFRDTGIKGITRFLERVWKFGQNSKIISLKAGQNAKLQFKIQNESVSRIVHKTIKKATDDVENLQYNTAISALMVLLNALEENPASVGKNNFAKFLQLLAPFAPHIAEELWAKLGGGGSIHLSKWPEADEGLLREEKKLVIIQINGKTRDRVEIDAEASERTVRALVLGRPAVKKWMAGKSLKKFIYVPGRIANIVI